MDGSLPATIRRGTLDFREAARTVLRSVSFRPASSFSSLLPAIHISLAQRSLSTSLSCLRRLLSFFLPPVSLFFDLPSRLPSSATPTRKFNADPPWCGTSCVRSPRIRESETEKIRFRRRAFEPPLRGCRSRHVDRTESIVSRTTRILLWTRSNATGDTRFSTCLRGRKDLSTSMRPFSRLLFDIVASHLYVLII